MELLWDLLSWVFLGAGTIAVLSSGIGFLRLPSLFTRLHAASVSETGGAGLILIGLCFQAGLSLATLKLILVLVFLILTGPPTSHALAKAAQMHDVVPEEGPGSGEGGRPSA